MSDRKGHPGSPDGSDPRLWASEGLGAHHEGVGQMPMTPQKLLTGADDDHIKALALRREPTLLEVRVMQLFDSGLDTDRLADWLTRERNHPVSEAEVYNLLGNAQYYRHVGVLPKFKGARP